MTLVIAVKNTQIKRDQMLMIYYLIRYKFYT